jgi:nuclear receptor subfamily 1 group F protein 4
MADRLTSCVQQIIDFSKMVPGFMQLQQDDQISLLKSGSYSISLLYATQCFSNETQCFHMANQKTLNVEILLNKLIAQQQHLQSIKASSSPQQQINSSLSLDEEEIYFVQENLEFIRQLKQFQLSNSELALLSAIILFNPDNAALNDHKAVYCAQQKFVEILRQDIENNRNQQTPSSLEKQQVLFYSIQHKHNFMSFNVRGIIKTMFNEYVFR